MLKYFTVLILLIHGTAVFAQNEANIWYFGHYVGMDFNYSPPKSLLTTTLSTDEGCSVACDENGDLLFYTDGITVWNKQHLPMPNGFNLLGNPSSTQSGLIVALPNSNDVFYVFTVDDKQMLQGLHYSIVDLKLEGGLGDVTEKNLPILDTTCEKIAAIPHVNKRDIWILTRKFRNDEYYSYLLTPTGLNTTPVISKSGYVVNSTDIPPRQVIGYMKASHDGKKIAATHYESYFIELSDFDNATGKISNTDTIAFQKGIGDYGLEFSPNNKYLYATQDNKIMGYPSDKVIQYDVSSNDIVKIRKSRFEVYEYKNDDGYLKNGIGAIQLAPNGKMYITYHNSRTLDVINNPDGFQSECNYVASDFILRNTAGWVLPTFAKTYFFPKIDFIAENNCFTDTTSFLVIGDEYTNLTWDFGDPASNAKNISTTINPYHIYSDTGSFTVTLYAEYYGIVDTIVKKIQIKEVPVVDLGEDKIYCDNEYMQNLEVQYYDDAIYKWRDGSNTYFNYYSGYDTVWVMVNKGGCIAYDTVLLQLKNSPYVYIDNYSEFCNGDSILLDISYPDAQYLWSDNSTDSVRYIKDRGSYYATITSPEGCSTTVSHNAYVFRLPTEIQLPSDTSVCLNPNEGLNLSVAYFDYYNYHWSDCSVESSTDIYTSGKYYLTVTNQNNCTITDSISVSVFPFPNVDLGLPESICGEETITLDAYYPNSTYLWNNGRTNQVLTPLVSGIYKVTITSEDGCEYSTEKMVTIHPTPVGINLPNDTLYCLEDNNYFEVTLPVSGFSYLWNDGSTLGSRNFTSSQNYIVTITTDDNCTLVDSVNIEYQLKPQKPLAESPVVCPGEIVPQLTAIGENIIWYSDADLTQIYHEGNTIDITNPEYRAYIFYVTQSTAFCESNPQKVRLLVLNSEQSPMLLSGDSTVCENTIEVPYTVTGSASVTSWNISGNRENYNLTEGQNTIYIDWTEQGVDTISVTAIDTNFCESTRMLLVNVAPFPKANFIATENHGLEYIAFENTTPPTIIVETKRALTHFNSWHFGRNGDEVIYHQGDTTLYYDYGYYNVTLYEENEFGSKDSLTKRVFMDINCKNLSVPNAFAPTNFAEKVRVFQPAGCNLKTYEISIYDKWGNLIWYSDKLENNQPAEAWDGKYDDPYVIRGMNRQGKEP
ncbi:MAG: hypothetical protein IPO21_03940 [Bacteroidales bacterium]|nr:hypothetical protein [Bacteroidales bacterium]